MEVIKSGIKKKYIPTKRPKKCPFSGFIDSARITIRGLVFFVSEGQNGSISARKKFIFSDIADTLLAVNPVFGSSYV